MLDEPNATHGLHRYWRSAFTERIPDELIDLLVDCAEPYLQGRVHVNRLAEDDRPGKVRASFGETYGRLRELFQPSQCLL